MRAACVQALQADRTRPSALIPACLAWAETRNKSKQAKTLLVNQKTFHSKNAWIEISKYDYLHVTAKTLHFNNAWIETSCQVQGVARLCTRDGSGQYAHAKGLRVWVHDCSLTNESSVQSPPQTQALLSNSAASACCYSFVE